MSDSDDLDSSYEASDNSSDEHFDDDVESSRNSSNEIEASGLDRLIVVVDDGNYCGDCFCMDRTVGGSPGDLKLGCGCLIHYDCLVQYIRAQLGDKSTLLNSIPKSLQKSDCGVLCPYALANTCDLSDATDEDKYFITPTDMNFLVTIGRELVGSPNIEEEPLREEEVDKLASWLSESPSTSDNVGEKKEYEKIDYSTDLFIEATTKPCPSCGVRGSHFHGHACHHISPGVGCTNCHTHYCFRCLSTEEENIKERKYASQCKCGFWSSFCSPLSEPSDIANFLVRKPYPHDKRCGCPICPECRYRAPCSGCDGHCAVCLGHLNAAPLEVSKKFAGAYAWDRISACIPAYKRLVEACKFSRFSEAFEILREEADSIDVIPDNLGRNALHYVCDGKSNPEERLGLVQEIVKVLPATLGLDDWHGFTPLHFAALSGLVEIVRVLSEADQRRLTRAGGVGRLMVDMCNEFQQTPLECACSAGEFECMMALLEAAPMGLRDNHTTEAAEWLNSKIGFALHRCARLGMMQMVTTLVGLGANINKRDFDGQTPLVVAATVGQVEIVEYLLLHGANASRKDSYGGTALYKAVSGEHLSVVLSLLRCEEGLKTINLRDLVRGETPLFKAARLGYVEIVKVLLQYGAKVLIKDNNCQSALYTARTPEIKALIKQRVSIEEAEMYGAGGGSNSNNNKKGKNNRNKHGASDGNAAQLLAPPKNIVAVRVQPGTKVGQSSGSLAVFDSSVFNKAPKKKKDPCSLIVSVSGLQAAATAAVPAGGGGASSSSLENPAASSSSLPSSSSSFGGSSDKKAGGNSSSTTASSSKTGKLAALAAKKKLQKKIKTDTGADTKQTSSIAVAHPDDDAAVAEDDAIGDDSPRYNTVCSTTAVALLQQEEMDVLSAIFEECDLNIVRAAPSCGGEPTACILVKLITNEALENMKKDLIVSQQPSGRWRDDGQGLASFDAVKFKEAGGVNIYERWSEQLYLKFEMTHNYPECGEEGDKNGEASLPSVELVIGSLSMLELPISVCEALTTVVRDCSVQNKGMQSAFSCVSVAREWIEAGHWKPLYSAALLHSTANKSVHYTYEYVGADTEEEVEAAKAAAASVLGSAPKSLSAFMVQKRNLFGMTQASLALAMNVQKQVIQQWEMGVTGTVGAAQPPTAAQMAKLNKIFGSNFVY